MTKRTNIFKKTNFLLLILSASILIPISSFAQTQVGWLVDVKIARTLNDKGFGGCMVQIDSLVNTATASNGDPLPTPLDCPSSWISLDCDAVYHTQAQSNAMWSSALVAFTLQKNVVIAIVDNEKYGNYCSARRMDVKR